MRNVENEIALRNVIMKKFVIKSNSAKGNLPKQPLAYETVKRKMEMQRENRTDNVIELLYTMDIGKKINGTKCKSKGQETKRSAISM